MEDRISTYPGRIKLTPVEGQENTYDMERMDSPIQQGTPINKISLLKDATAALYGLGADAVPDDVLAFVGKYNEHWWKVTDTQSNVTYVTNADKNAYPTHNSKATITPSYGTKEYVYLTASSSTDNSVYTEYSDTVIYNPISDSVELLNPKYLYLGYTSATTLAEPLRGTFFIKRSSSNTVYYAEKDATINKRDNYTEIRISASPVTFSVKTAEPNVMYEYIGKPFEYLLKNNNPVQIIEGRYVGTGTIGSDNPVTIYCGFRPKLFIITGFMGGRGGYTTSNDLAILLPARGSNSLQMIATSNMASVSISTTDDSISYWSTKTDYSGGEQYNQSRKLYWYVAMG